MAETLHMRPLQTLLEVGLLVRRGSANLTLEGPDLLGPNNAPRQAGQGDCKA